MTAEKGEVWLKAVLRKQLKEVDTKSWPKDTEPDPDNSCFDTVVSSLRDLAETTVELNLSGDQFEGARDQLFFKPLWQKCIVGVVTRAVREVQFPKLEVLDLSSSNFSAKGMLALAAAICAGHLPLLQSLNLNYYGPNRHIEDNVWEDLGRAFSSRRCPSLKVLKLVNIIGSGGVMALIEAIQDGCLPSLEELQLDGNVIRDDALISLVTGLTVAASLDERSTEEVTNEFITLNADRIKHLNGDVAQDSVLAFVSCSNTALKILSLSKTGLGPKGVTALAKVIENGCLPALEELNLQYNAIGNKGLAALPTALGSGTSCSRLLKKVKLDFTPGFSEANTIDLARACMSGNLDNLTHLLIGCFNDRDDRSLLLPLVKALEDGYLPKLEYLEVATFDWREKNGRALINAMRSNPSLILDVRCGYYTDGYGTFETLRERNRKRKELLRHLGKEEVKATDGKIFLCGHPEVVDGQCLNEWVTKTLLEGEELDFDAITSIVPSGQTTLRRSLQNTLPNIANKFIRERGLRHEPRTRGIDVSYIMRGERQGSTPPNTLALWDLAGQPEYQILHNAFLPDMGFADGQATTFVLVCNAEYNSDSDPEVRKWMRFIASSSHREHHKRHVILVLNRFKDEPCTSRNRWNSLVRSLKNSFHDYLEIYPEPVEVDARVANSVRKLKDLLIQWTRERLQKKTVPKICRDMQENIRERRKGGFPIISSAKFTSFFDRDVFTVEILQAATEYLHQSGHLIHFRETSVDSLRGDVVPGKSLVVLDPDWFCKKVVGHLLLPEELLDAEETPIADQLRPDGSLNLKDFSEEFRHLELSAEQVSNIIVILLKLGICYMVGSDKVLIPALIREKTQPQGCWAGTGGQAVKNQWVMGYCLRVKYQETTLLPIAVFRRLQVQLAQDPDYNSEDGEYTAGKFFITFKKGALAVLVEVSQDERNHDTQDRVDILVRPQVSRENDEDASRRKELQMDMVQTMVEKIVSLAETWSPGVEFVHELVKPSCTTKGTLPMKDRVKERWERISLEELNHRIHQNGPSVDLSWVVNGQVVKGMDLLSQKQLRDLEHTVRRKCNSGAKLLVDYGLVYSNDNHPRNGQLVADRNVGPYDDLLSFLENNFRHVYRKLDDMNRKLDDIQGVRKDLVRVIDRQQELLQKVLALERFSQEQIQCSVPRFVYFVNPREGSGMWIFLKDKFVETMRLHFLCELHHKHRVVHEVDGQEGIEVTNLRQWAKRIRPWVLWSARVAAVIGRIASQALLPGLVQLITMLPDGDAQSESNADVASAYGLTAALLAGAEVNLADGKVGPSGLQESSPSSPVMVKDDLREILKALMGDMQPSVFHAKFKLRRAVRTGDDEESGHIVWVCDNCYTELDKIGEVKYL